MTAGGPHDPGAIERSAADVAEAIRLATRLLRALTPVLQEMRDLQQAVAALQQAASFAPTAPGGAFDGTMPPSPSPTQTPGRAEEEPEPAPNPTTPAPRPLVPFPAGRAEGGGYLPAHGAPPAPRRRTVSVTVTRAEGPLDLVRIHGALEALPGVSGLALTGYTRGRAGMVLETDQPPDQLPLHEALLAVFPEGVTGRWQGDSEFVATVGPATPAPPH